jgi:hypothetical protein
MQKEPLNPPQNNSSGNSNDYPFQLEKHPKIKGKCPQCGQTKVFRYYEDRNGNRIGNAGICDRQSNCGYHAKPNNEQIKAIISQESTPKVESQKSEIIFPDVKILAKISAYEKDHSSHFHKLCEKLQIPISHLIHWGVGTDKTETVFVLRNHEHKIANTKYFRYLVTGKRDKTFTSFSLRQPKDLKKKYTIPLYGEHLLDTTRQKTVCVVESEKTAVIASWFYPHFDFVACGAANGLTGEKLSVLYGRKIYWLADADKAGRENSSLKNLKAYEQNFELIDVFPNRQDGTDLADAIIEGIELSCELEEWGIEPSNKEDESTTKTPITGRYKPIQKGLPNEFWYLEETQKHFDEWNFVEYQGRYWFGKYNDDDGTYNFKPVSNFIIHPVLLIKSVQNPKRIFEVKNVHGKYNLLNLEPSDFVSLDGFTKRIESVGNYLLDGCIKSHFTKIKAKLYEQTCEALEIKTLGYQTDDFYAFANGIVSQGKFQAVDENGYGIVSHLNNKYFIPAMSKIYKDDENEYPNQKKFIYQEGKITFEEYATMFCNVHGSNGRVGLLYYLSALYRDIIYERFRFFPHLFLFGPPQSGKSTMAISSLYLFGRIRPAFPLNTGTNVGFYKHFAEFRNALIWFDEYLNSIEPQRVQSLKTAYDGNGHTRSDNTADNRNKSIPIHSGSIISGQDLPTADPALFTRCILLTYGKTDFTIEEKKALSDFHELGESMQVAHLTAQMVTHRELVKTKFFKVFDQVSNNLKAKFPGGIDDRIVKNMSILLTIYEVLKEVVKFPFSDEELMQTFMEIILKQNGQISSSKETATFWKTVAFMAANKQVKEGVDFQISEETSISIYRNGGNEKLILDKGNLKKVIFIRFTKIHPLYLETFRRQYNKTGLDEGSIKHYLETSNAFLGYIRSKKMGKSTNTAYAFDYTLLTHTIDDFAIDIENEDNTDSGTQSTDNQQVVGF